MHEGGLLGAAIPNAAIQKRIAPAASQAEAREAGGKWHSFGTA